MPLVICCLTDAVGCWIAFLLKGFMNNDTYTSDLLERKPALRVAL
jgi:hypothetical protein